MRKWECDRCKKIVDDNHCCETYSRSKGRKVDLCRDCYDKHEKALAKADADFFKEKGE